MSEIDDLLQTTSHRPWSIPTAPWSYYQEWNNALFLHWKVPTGELTELIPKNISIDTIKGESWISLVAFAMQRIRPRGLPSISIISDFCEVNVRAYLTKNNKKGVLFLSIEAEKQISPLIAKLISGLPYEKTKIRFQREKDSYHYTSTNKSKGFKFAVTFAIREKIGVKSELDTWLTERYCLYLKKGEELYRYETHHLPWELSEIEISHLCTSYTIGNISLARKPDLAHYSEGVKVLAWKREHLI